MQDNLKFTLKLQGSGKSLSIPCGNIASVHTAIHSYGYEGIVEFWIDANEEIDFFYELPLIQVTLTILSQSAPDAIKPLELEGVVTKKALVKESFNANTSGLKVLFRALNIHFKDPLQAMWAQHFPSEIFTQKAMADVLNTYLPGSIKLKIESEVVKKQRPLIALGLGAPHNGASFYSFVMWYLNEIKHVWEYNYQTKEYVIADKKSNGTTVDLPFDEGEAVVSFPEPFRQDTRVINSYAHNPSVHKAAGMEIYEKVSRDSLIATPLQNEIEAEITKTKPLAHTLEHRLDLYLARLPIIDFFPGQGFTFNHLHWSEQLFFKKKTYRLVSIFLAVQAVNLDLMEKGGHLAQVYIGTAQASLELKEETLINRPSFIVPHYPFSFEGEVFSGIGGENDFTFDIGKDEESSQMYYTVELSGANNQHVMAPFEPTYVNGQTYFPLGKKQRVLLHFNLFTTKIVSVLEWLIPAALPIEIQGNRIVFTPKKEDKAFTILEHREEDGHLLFFIHRKSDPQSQIIRIEETGLFLIVQKENENDPQCVVWLDNNETITIKSQNIQAKQTQVATLKPKEISIVCEEGGDKSSWVQTPTSITIECKEFNLKTDTTSFISKENTSCQGKKIDLKGSQGITMKDDVSVKAETKTVNMDANTINLNGNVNAG